MKPTKSKPVNVLVCRVGRRPVVEQLKRDDDYSHLTDMQRIVGGSVQVVTLDDGVDVWLNEDGIGLGLPLNRVIAAAPRPAPTLFGEPSEIIYADEGLARPGEPGEWRFLGDFFLALTTPDGEVASLDDANVKKYTELFEAEDIEASKKMNELRAKLENASWG